MRHTGRPQRGSLFRPLAVATLAALLSPGAAPSGARAESKSTADPERTTARARLELPIDTSPGEASRVPDSPLLWMGEHVQFRKGAGLEYRRSLRMGGQALELGVQGPVIRKKKRFGLTLFVRF